MEVNHLVGTLGLHETNHSLNHILSYVHWSRCKLVEIAIFVRHRVQRIYYLIPLILVRLSKASFSDTAMVRDKICWAFRYSWDDYNERELIIRTERRVKSIELLNVLHQLK